MEEAAIRPRGGLYVLLLWISRTISLAADKRDIPAEHDSETRRFGEVGLVPYESGFPLRFAVNAWSNRSIGNACKRAQTPALVAPIMTVSCGFYLTKGWPCP